MFITIIILHGLTRTILLPFVRKKQKPYVRKTSYSMEGEVESQNIKFSGNASTKFGSVKIRNRTGI